jgi:hypothetical protein
LFSSFIVIHAKKYLKQIDKGLIKRLYWVSINFSHKFLLIHHILSTVDENIKRYGYSVIVFHPNDFMYTDENGRIVDGSTINSTEFQDFVQLVDTVLSKIFVSQHYQK